MCTDTPGRGSVYAIGTVDSHGRFFDGGKTYKVTLPGPVPAQRFWSLNIYDNQTRSLLETDQMLAGVDSTVAALKANPDGSFTVWFSPTAPAGHEGNWVQTIPGKGWNTILRLYAPLQPWFDKSWKPGDFELVKQSSDSRRRTRGAHRRSGSRLPEDRGMYAAHELFANLTTLTTSNRADTSQPEGTSIARYLFRGQVRLAAFHVCSRELRDAAIPPGVSPGRA